MSRTAPTNIGTQLTDTLTQPYYLIKIELTAGTLLHSTLYDATYDGDSYTADRKVRLNEIVYTADGTQTSSIIYGNAANLMSVLFLAEDDTDVPVTIYKAYGEPSGVLTSSDVLQVFTGVINDRSMNLNTVTIQIMSKGAVKFSPGFVINRTDFRFLPSPGIQITSGATTITLGSR